MYMGISRGLQFINGKWWAPYIRGSIVQRFNEFFTGELIMFSYPVLANILMFRSTASNVLRVVDFEEKSPEVVAKQIVRECKGLCINRNLYNTRTSTLLTLLSNVSEKLDNNLLALLIGNIVTSMVTNKHLFRSRWAFELGRKIG